MSNSNAISLSNLIIDAVVSFGYVPAEHLIYPSTKPRVVLQETKVRSCSSLGQEA